MRDDVTKADSWLDLFSASSTKTEPVRFRILRKHGEPLLVLPNDTGCAAQSLALYPAQSWRARFARSITRLLLSLGAPIAREHFEARVDMNGPLARFLCQTAKVDGLPQFAIFNGNAKTPGRRFVILVFDARGIPAAVIKAGTTPLAKSLILREASFLKSVKRPGVPTVRGECTDDSMAAFALDFVPGDSPRNCSLSQLASLLAAWLYRDRTVKIGELPQWKQLQEATGNTLPALISLLAERTILPAIAHGDFAPWNVKVMPDNSWTILDWERGELNGIPGWDWFHFVIQPLVLAQKRSAVDVLHQIETLLNSTEFSTYADAARIGGLEKLLLQAYLAWMLHVVRPAEGAQTMQELLELLFKDDPSVQQPMHPA
jgi:hypothetical protein